MKISVQIKSALLATTVIGAGWGYSASAWAAAEGANVDDSAVSANEIVVTAQRIEQRLQDVPISITVLDQKALTNNNVVGASDLAAYTPGLAVNTRYGNDSSTFTVRGFSQEQRTTATVATYFADVVALRGSGVIQGGDGAGPGQLFDLQNVQVLKGPQGTLFGRNTTGGAVLLVPQRPTRKLEGYVEGSLGDYDMRRVQAVLNVPVSENLRIRAGVDRNIRDGYLNNIGLGRKDMGNVDYWSGRFSMIADITPNFENYTVGTYTKSKSAGTVPKVVQAFNGMTQAQMTAALTPSYGGVMAGIVAASTFGPCAGQAGAQLSPATSYGFCNMPSLAQGQINNAAGQGPWTVQNSLPTSRQNSEQWQVINTSTWQANDNLTIKNIISYGEYRQSAAQDLYGLYLPVNGATYGTISGPKDVVSFAYITPDPQNDYTNAQSTFVDEFRLQGQSDNARLTWQAGLYYELSKPLAPSSALGPNWTPCASAATLDCLAPSLNNSAGYLNFYAFSTTFKSKAAYAQASYELSDQVKVTGGIRYTEDTTSSNFRNESVNLNHGMLPTSNNTSCVTTTVGLNEFPLADRYLNCARSLSTTSKAPTWLLGIDYKPMDNILLYVKWSRGYRQGSLIPVAPAGYESYEPEKVDTYEVGAKTSWRGVVPGSFNISGFYNDFKNQQLQIGWYATNPAFIPTTSIANAGSSRIYGLEAEASLSPIRGLNLNLAYAYLNTKILRVEPAPVIAGLRSGGFPTAGDPLPLAIPHKLTANASYRLPLPESIGKISIGGNLVHTSSHIVNTQKGRLPAYTYGNVNLNWDGVAGLPVDMSVFITNVTNKLMYNNINVQAQPAAGYGGFYSYSLAEPRMYGVRLKYRFGS